MAACAMRCSPVEKGRIMAKPQNAFLAKLQAQAAKKESYKTSAHVEIDTMAMLLAAHDRLKVGPGRAPDLVNDFLL